MNHHMETGLFLSTLINCDWEWEIKMRFDKESCVFFNICWCFYSVLYFEQGARRCTLIQAKLFKPKFSFNCLQRRPYESENLICPSFLGRRHEKFHNWFFLRPRTAAKLQIHHLPISTHCCSYSYCASCCKHLRFSLPWLASIRTYEWYHIFFWSVLPIIISRKTEMKCIPIAQFINFNYGKKLDRGIFEKLIFIPNYWRWAFNSKPINFENKKLKSEHHMAQQSTSSIHSVFNFFCNWSI